MFSKIFAVGLIAASSLLSFASNTVSASAASTNFRIVSAKSGLNIRDKNCNRINTIDYGEIIFNQDGGSIYCTVNGKKLKFIPYSNQLENTSGYIAELYTKVIKIGPAFQSSQATYEVTATSGLNLRDYACKKNMSVPYKTSLKNPLAGREIVVCERDGEFYEMSSVIYNGKDYITASYYLK